MGEGLKPLIVLSGVNFVEGGPLTVFANALQTLSTSFLDRFAVTALVHRAELYSAPGINFLEFPDVKKSWLRRLYFEYVQCRALSRSLKPFLWLSMHDITPNTVAAVRALYCHNPAPFYGMPLNEALRDRTFTLFRLLYRFLYRINIAKNDFVIVQQEWLRTEFCRRYPVREVVVAHPSIPTLSVQHSAPATGPRPAHYMFFYPALARPFKNFELLLKATQSLEGRGVSGFQVQVTIDGTENSYARSLRTKFNELKSVQWLGQQTRVQVEELYETADCLVFPSKLETWGMPISEWKRTKKPMLVADLPYAHETVGDYPDVSFLDVHDAEALAGMMETMITGGAVLPGSKSEPIAALFAANWNELFAILLAGADSGAGRDGMALELQQNAEAGAV